MSHIWNPEELHLPQAFVDALNYLNWNYGRGDVIGFADFSMSGPGGGIDKGFVASGHGTVVCKLQYGEEWRKFRVVNGTLHFRGHQKTLHDPGE